MSNFPRLTSLNLFITSLPSGWGAVLALACRNLANIYISWEGKSGLKLASDIEALKHSSLHSLQLWGFDFHDAFTVRADVVQACGQLTTLHSLSLSHCDAVFSVDGVAALRALPSLTELDVSPKTEIAPGSAMEQGLITLLHSLPNLFIFFLRVPVLALRVAHAIAHHPSISCLILGFASADDKALSTIVSESTSITVLEFMPSYFCSNRPRSLPRLTPAQLAVNPHITSIDPRLIVDTPKANKQADRILMRNLRVRHNWQCICVLLASYRANAHSLIRDSILPLVCEVSDFLVSDDEEVDRNRVATKTKKND
jgi:hypothetical protein